MAILRETLPTPEEGWRRINDTNVKAMSKITGTWTEALVPQNYGGNQWYCNTVGDTWKFGFYGTKFRFLTQLNQNRATNNVVIIDGVEHIFNSRGDSSINMALVVDVIGLEKKNHEVTFKVGTDGYFVTDCIDIDADGYILSPPRVIGDKLLMPDIGWKRYDDSNPGLLYSAGFSWIYDASCWKSGRKETVSHTGEATIEFKFQGGGFRIVGSKNTVYSGSISVLIDGVNSGTYSINGTPDSMILLYEISNLSDTTHTVKLVCSATPNSRISFDCIDLPANSMFDGYEDLIPTLTSNTSHAPEFIVSTSSELNATMQGWKVFNKTNINDSDCWHSNNQANNWLQIKFNKAKMVKGFTFHNRNNSNFIYQQAFDIFVSANGTDFVNVGTFTNPSGACTPYVVNLPEQMNIMAMKVVSKVSNYTTFGEIYIYGFSNNYPELTITDFKELQLLPVSGGLQIEGNVSDSEDLNVNLKIDINDQEVVSRNIPCGGFTEVLNSSHILLPLNVVNVYVVDSGNARSNYIFYVIKIGDNIMIPFKGGVKISVPNIPIESKKVVISLDNTGKVIPIMINGNVQTIAKLDNWIDIIGHSGEISVLLLMSQLSIIKAYGVGW